MEVKYIDHMGDDLRVVNAARVSFHKESEWEECEEDEGGWWDGESDLHTRLSETDQKLIRYLAKHNHWTPFSHVQITLREKVPIFVARQRFKHMVGFSYNEVSRRYVDDAPEFFVPESWRGRPVNSKQGSSDEVIEWLPYDDHDVGPRAEIHSRYKYFLDSCRGIYEQMIAGGVAPEQARMVLPQSMYTEYYVTGSLAAWARAYRLRSEPHAQKEIRDLAAKWKEVFDSLEEMKCSWNALTQS